MRRRELIASGAAAAMLLPIPAWAQQKARPVIGFLSGSSPAETAPLLDFFRKGLGETGYTEGDNVAIEYRWAEGKYDRLPGLADELVRRPVAVLASFGSPAAFAAKAATETNEARTAT